MRKVRFAALVMVMLLTAGMLSACSGNSADTGNDTEVTSQAQNNTNDVEATTAPTAAEDTPDTADTADASENTDASGAGNDTSSAAEEVINITTPSGQDVLQNNGCYTITAAGEYTFTGTLSEGRIVVNAPDQEVYVILAGVTLSSSEDSVIFIESAEEAIIVAQSGTENTLNDNRARKVGNDDLSGNACIYSKDDMTVQGKGKLTINASYNKGIHSKNDVKIKNLTLDITSAGTSLQGNDSVTIKSGTITLVSTEGDGIKTKDTDVSSKGKQRGIVTIESGTVTITAADECIDAAYGTDISSEAVVTQNGK